MAYVVGSPVTVDVYLLNYLPLHFACEGGDKVVELSSSSQPSLVSWERKIAMLEWNQSHKVFQIHPEGVER
jgi:hypothetical protein